MPTFKAYGSAKVTKLFQLYLKYFKNSPEIISYSLNSLLVTQNYLMWQTTMLKIQSQTLGVICGQ